MRVEEKAKFQKEFDTMKQDLERTYERKAKALMEREKNAIDRMQKQQEVKHGWSCFTVALSQNKVQNFKSPSKKKKLVYIYISLNSKYFSIKYILLT